MMTLLNRSLIAPLLVALLAGCSAQRVPGMEVVDTHGSIRNFGNMDEFLRQAKTGAPAALRVTRYTVEGDPIYLDLTASEGKIQVRYDNSKDKFAGSGQREQVNSCDRLEKNETPVSVSYELSGCTGPSDKIPVLGVAYDVEKQDVFEFALKYGADRQNEISTFDQKLAKDLGNGQFLGVADFGLSKAGRQNVYKTLILADFLGKKTLSDAACSPKPENRYYLKVKINGGTSEFLWSDCDKSEDGITMTQAAKEIVKRVEAEYQQISGKGGGM
jgi:hypothetical protein